MNSTPCAPDRDELLHQARATGPAVAVLGNSAVSPRLVELATSATQLQGAAEGSPFTAAEADTLSRHIRERTVSRVGLLIYSGAVDRASIATFLASLPALLADRAGVLVDHADFTSVYDGIVEALAASPGFRLEEIFIDHSAGARSGQGVARLSFDSARTLLQAADSLPAPKNKRLGEAFVAATPQFDPELAAGAVLAALACWTPKTEVAARAAFATMQDEFPDGASPKTYWHDAYEQGFTEFFAWGHDQDFGFGLSRQGTMSTRHIEIISEAIEYGYLPQRLEGLEVLDIGCWTGGDVLALAGLGGRVTAIEEHPVSALAAKRLCDVLRVPATVLKQSLYSDNPDWHGRFDLIYFSGVIYHVSDPLLALRICFSYLKPGGSVIVETKASKLDGPYCEYGGTQEKGWNWYSPTLETLGRWLVDAGFVRQGIRLHMRPVGRLLALGVKQAAAALPERAGFSRPNSWLEGPL